ncbi:MAG: pitrilysin family protein [Lachnospiraceae bacterium]|nr:pitrilysin family protein [Lachnospiraceae bacterium]
MEKEYRTQNKISVFYDRNDKIHSFCLCLYVRGGSLFETKKNNGISHFFEHIVFRNIHHVMEGKMYPVLDRLGLDFNAATYEEFIQFIITGAPAHFTQAAEILSKIFEPLSLSEEEIDVERKRIKAEIREENEEESLEYFTRKIVWKDTSLARTITGKKKSLNKIGKKELQSFQEETLTSGNIFFYLTGNFPENAPEILDKKMGKYVLKSGEKVRKNLAPVPKKFFRRPDKIYVKKGEKTSVCFSLDIDVSHFTLAERNLLFDILFEGEVCKIHQELSEKKGYIYSYDPVFSHYNNIGQMTLTYEVSPKYLYDSVKTVIDILKDMKEGITDELTYVLPHYVDNAGFLLDDAEDYNWVRAYEEHILGIPFKDLKERTDSYRNVSRERMTQICREVFQRSNLVFAVKGNKKEIDRVKLGELLSCLD